MTDERKEIETKDYSDDEMSVERAKNAKGTLKRFFKDLMNQKWKLISEFDEKLWLTVIDTVTVHADGRLTFKFQGGTEIDA